MGYLARSGALDVPAMRRAIVVGSVLASFAVEQFSLDRLRDLGPARDPGPLRRVPAPGPLRRPRRATSSRWLPDP